MKFKGLELDDFQIKSIESINKNHSCVVSASTGTGKTLIAEYIISKFLPEGKTIIYTAPIKALSNQKFKDFTNDYGVDKVGLMTGDICINQKAPILIMTTEIYRNMLLSNDQKIDEVSYVIFDEVHYINDIERGSIWEESLIFSPKHVRFLCLSATIPNYKEFAAWIESIKGHTVDTVSYTHRPVPLTHYVFDKKLGLTTIDQVEIDKIRDKELEESLHLYQSHQHHATKKKKRNPFDMPIPNHFEVIEEILDKTPALYFCFSRKRCEDFAVELSSKKDLLKKENHHEVSEAIRKHITEQIRPMDTTKKLRRTLLRGIGFHHSGMLPQLKALVEELFAKSLIKVLYTTETFSVGINMPAKTVIFNSIDKYDGRGMRILNSKEYFQIAGRAGRRGIDKEGTVISLISRRFTPLDKLKSISSTDKDPIISQFKLSMNTVINLIQNFDPQDQEVILKSNFDYYVRSQKQKSVNVMASFKNKIKKLMKLDFVRKTNDVTKGAYVEIDREYELTEKGLFARGIYAYEVEITELCFLNHLDKFTDTDILCLLSAITYEPRRLDHFAIKGSDKQYNRILKLIRGTYIEGSLNKLSLKRMINFVNAWYDGKTFLEIMKLTNMQEGDIIRFFRRLIDVFTQIQHSTNNEDLKSRVEGLIGAIDRDLVAVEDNRDKL